jgi:general secretion pathway protein G
MNLHQRSAVSSPQRPRRRAGGLPAGCRGAGITLVELVVVLAIAALLAAIGAPLYASYVEKARLAAAIADIKKLEVQIQRYVSDAGTLPDTLADLGSPAPIDPWGHAYRYLNLQTLAPGDKSKVRKDKNLVPINSDYDLYSAGPDGDSTGPLAAKASLDDVIRAGNGGFIGPASEH